MEHEQLLKYFDYYLTTISTKLAAGQLTDDRERHCFAFMEMELAAIVRSLRTPPTPSHGVDGHDRQTWLQELRRLASEIEHLMANHGEADHHPPTRFVLLRRATRCFRVRRRMGMDLYSQFQEEAHQLHLAAEDPCMCKHLRSHPPPPESVAGGDHLVGIKGPAKKLLRWLMNAETSLQFMAIVGPIGVGKTALAMEVHSRVRCQPKYFEFCAIANRTRRREPVRTRLFLRSILSQITDMEESSSSHNSESETNEELAAHIWKHLQYKRYFILIDDISKDSDWGIINDAFPTNHCGSRILLTTRNELIANFCNSNYDGEVHTMKPLSDSNSDRLLRTKAFGSMDYCPPDNLKLLCEEISKICGGIPLYVTSMAEWLKQHQPQHESSAVPAEEQARLLLKRFGQKLSFKYNDTLRPSLYLSMFPQGYVFDKNHFAMKWLEEGLAGIHSGLKVDMEQAKMSFTEMVDMNIISPVAENCGLNLDEDELCQWQVNPFMHKFLASKAAEKGYVFTSTTLPSVTDDGNMARTARRLALHNADPRLPAMLQQMDLSHTRSLLISGVVDRTAVPLNKFSYLVVLDLQGWENLKDEDLLQICKMFLLTYLSIRRTRVSKLPPEIKELRILNTLDVSRTHIAELPSELCELSCLRMLDLRCTQISQVPEQIEVLYLRFRTLLIGGDGMINPDETVVVTKIPHTLMTNLQLFTLATVDLSEYPASFVDALGCQNSLRVLAIIWSLHQSTDEAYREALRSSIKKCMELRSLTIHCARGCSMEFLGSLSDPPKELKKFKVTTGRFVSVPQWIRGLEHLAFLQITVCKLEPDDVKILGSLRCLKCLILGLEFVPEEGMVIESEWFGCLERFSLDCPVPWLTFKRGAMPMLNYLQLKICSGSVNQVSAVPSGLTKLPKITEVVICYSKWCKNSSNVKMTVGAVRKQLARHPGQIDLVIDGRQTILTQRYRATESGTKNDVHQLMWTRGQ